MGNNIKFLLFFILLQMLFVGCTSIYTPPEVEFIKTEQCKDCEEFLKNRHEIVINFIVENNKEYCFDYFIRKGDRFIVYNGLTYGQPSSSFKYYQKAISLFPNNKEAIFKLANEYLIMDSIELAEYYLSKINDSYLELPDRSSYGVENRNYSNTNFPEINIQELKKKFRLKDSLIQIFLENGENSRLRFDYKIYWDNIITQFIQSNLSSAYGVNQFLEIDGTGKFEACIYLDSNMEEKQCFKGVFPQQKLIDILETFETNNFPVFNKFFVYEEKEINRYYYDDKWLMYQVPTVFERITIETPEFEHSINVYDLVEPDSFIYPRERELNCIEGDDSSYICRVLKIYSDLWNELFSEELLKYAEEED